MLAKVLKYCLLFVFACCFFAASLAQQTAARADQSEMTQNIVRFSENFDNVAAPQLPEGWTTSTGGAGINFATTTNLPDTIPNAAFAASSASTGISDLVSPPILVSGVTSILSFRNRYSVENTWDGAVLEIKIGDGGFQDIIDAGGAFISGGYTTLLNPSTNPLANRRAWSGATPAAYITSSVRLPASTLGQTVRFRWRLGTNDSFSADGIWIDSITLENVTTGANTAPISIPDSGTASPYPAGIQISGLNGVVTDIVVGLEGFSHTAPDDADVLLVAPDGRNIILLSDVGGTSPATGLNLTMLDSAAQNLPDNSSLSSGVFRPTNFEPIDSFPSPAPQTPTGQGLGAFYGTNPNGTWSLYVVDDNGNNAGTIAGGWNLSIRTAATACLPSVSPGAQSFPASGGTGGFQITTPAGCGWAVSTANPFITINSPTAGIGNSTVNFTVSANGGAARTGLITITDGFNPRTFQVQQGSGCPTSLGQTNLDFAASGGSGNVSVTAAAGCIWHAISKAAWVEITSSQQTGSGTVTFNVLPNTTRNARSTTLLVGARTLTINQAGVSPPRFDFDGDGRSDVSVFRSGTWFLQQSTNGFAAVQFGVQSDQITPADFDGDGKTDIAVFRAGVWYVLQSSNTQFFSVQFGLADDIPVPADFDGDGRAELAVFRNGIWYVLNLANNQTAVAQFGLPGDKPVVADYDGDGSADLAVFRNGTWYVQRTSLGLLVVNFGLAADKPVVGDYDGDGKSDPAVFRSGAWHILAGLQNYSVTQFGVATDLPVAADYDGDGRDDIAVFRDGAWYLLRSTQGVAVVQFGLAGDKPVPNAFVQ